MSSDRLEKRDPETPEEWQEAVDVAAFLRMLHDCKLYGLIEGGPETNIDRCDDILERGSSMGIRPVSEDQLIERYAASVI